MYTFLYTTGHILYVWKSFWNWELSHSLAALLGERSFHTPLTQTWRRNRLFRIRQRCKAWRFCVVTYSSTGLWTWPSSWARAVRRSRSAFWFGRSVSRVVLVRFQTLFALGSLVLEPDFHLGLRQAKEGGKVSAFWQSKVLRLLESLS